VDGFIIDYTLEIEKEGLEVGGFDRVGDFLLGLRKYILGYHIYVGLGGSFVGWRYIVLLACQKCRGLGMLLPDASSTASIRCVGGCYDYRAPGLEKF
jgi:hypothetical protein